MTLKYAVLWFDSRDLQAGTVAIKDAEVAHAALLVMRRENPVALYEYGVPADLKRIALNGKPLSRSTAVDFRNASWGYPDEAWQGAVVETGAMQGYIDLADLNFFGRSFAKIRGSVGSRDYPYNCRGGVDYLLHFSANDSKRRRLSTGRAGCCVRSASREALDRIVML